MKSDLQSAVVFAHRANIDRFRKLLKGNLGVNEREYIGRLLEDEQTALLETVSTDPLSATTNDQAKVRRPSLGTPALSAVSPNRGGPMRGSQ